MHVCQYSNQNTHLLNAPPLSFLNKRFWLRYVYPIYCFDLEYYMQVVYVHTTLIFTFCQYTAIIQNNINNEMHVILVHTETMEGEDHIGVKKTSKAATL
jgi:hypothetical protein